MRDRISDMRYHMKLKICITGRNPNIIDDVAEHLKEDRGYYPAKIPPRKDALFDMVMEQRPRVIIICMGDETEDGIGTYDVLNMAFRQGNCTIIVIAGEEDEKLFMKHSELEHVLFLSRPVSLFALYEKLAEIEELQKKETEENLGAFREHKKEGSVLGFRRKHILVVDDDPEQLMMIRDQLREFYEVTLVKSGQAAIKAMAREIPDLVLLDYLMPGEDGPSFLRRMRTLGTFADIPVVFLTGMKEKQVVMQTIAELKPKGYIIKPSKKSEIVAKIIDVLG